MEGVLCDTVPQKLNNPRVLGVLSGGDFPISRLESWFDSADIVLAADGGANYINSVNREPNVVIGDFDSMVDSTNFTRAELVYIGDQDTTDCDKLLAFAVKQGYEHITLVCVEGDLLDHVLGTLFSAAKLKINVRVALRRGVAYILNGPTHRQLKLPEDTRVSLMPLSHCHGVTIEGAAWPLSEAELHPLGANSLSNKASGDLLVRLGSGSAVLFVAHEELEKPFW